jgi:hypothetical protein
VRTADDICTEVLEQGIPFLEPEVAGGWCVILANGYHTLRAALARLQAENGRMRERNGKLEAEHSAVWLWLHAALPTLHTLTIGNWGSFVEMLAVVRRVNAACPPPEAEKGVPHADA